MTTVPRPSAGRPGAAGVARELLRRTAPFVPGDGSATRSLADSMQRAFLVGTLGWQVLMVAAVFAAPGPVSRLLPLLAAHVAAVVLTWLVRPGGLPAWVPLATTYALFIADWAVADSANDPLLFAACWMMNLAGATPTFLLRGRSALLVPAVASVAVTGAMLVLRPDLGPALPVSVLLTQVSIVLATRIAQSYLYDFAALADEASAAARRDQAAAAVQAAASRASAEDARVLHDTVINTLAALASGGAAVSDVQAVRERCARDIATVAALRDGADPDVDESHGLRAASYDTRVRVHHRGLSDEDLAALESGLPPRQRRALQRAVAELVQNAAKHAGVDEVEVRAERRGSELRVTVADDGAGFDGHVGASGGLATSVRARALDAGVGVVIDTAPGAGTRVALTVDVAGAVASPAPDPQGDIADVVMALRRRACLLYSVGVAVIGFYLAVANHLGEVSPELAMAALALLGAGLGWRSTRVHGVLPVSVVAVLVVASGTAFVLSAAAVDYGREEAPNWQAVGATGMLVLIAEFGRRAALIAACAAYGAVVLTVAALVARSDGPAAIIVLMAGAAAFGLVAGWRRFQHIIAAIGAAAAADQHAAWTARTRLAEREAADRSRARWRDAGLNRSLELLETARSADDPGDPALRPRFAAEEAYLRQLTLLHPDLVHVGQWFARALNDAHDNGVRLVVRSGATDLPTDLAADLGGVLLAAVADAPSGADLTVTLFPDPAGARLTLVGAHPYVGAGVRAAAGPLGAAARVRSIGEQEMAEILIDLSA